MCELWDDTDGRQSWRQGTTDSRERSEFPDRLLRIGEEQWKCLDCGSMLDGRSDAEEHDGVGHVVRDVRYLRMMP